MSKWRALAHVLETIEEKAEAFLAGQEAATPLKLGNNYVVEGRNVEVMRSLYHSGVKFDFIYLDPPFYTMMGHHHRIKVGKGKGALTFKPQAYRDVWQNFGDYLEQIGLSLYLARCLLSDRGSLCLHVDFRTSAYFKIFLDEIFGERNFINTIIWAYKSGGAPKRYFARKYDELLIYAKTADYIFHPQKEKSYNRGGKAYRFKGVEEFEDDKGWYTMVQRRDVWHIPMVGRTSSERTGYPTQKPERLLELLVTAFSDESSKVADFYAGSGTLGAVAHELGRTYLLCDESPQAISVIEQRLIEDEKLQVLRDEPANLKFIKFRKNLGSLLGVPYKADILTGKEREALKVLVEDEPFSLFHSLIHESFHQGKWKRVFYGEGDLGLQYGEKIPLLRGKQRIIIENKFGQRYAQDMIGSDKYEKT